MPYAAKKVRFLPAQPAAARCIPQHPPASRRQRDSSVCLFPPRSLWPAIVLTVIECIGCGWCCLHDQCELSQRLYGYCRRCPDITWDAGQGRYLCGLLSDAEHREEARSALFLGQGCCNRFTSWRLDVRDRDEEYPA